jgi:hypothetical protein
MKLQFTLEKTTKGALRYQEVPPKDQDPKVGTLYIRKSGLAGEPQKIEVEITVK